jgi:hypothetical protein
MTNLAERLRQIERNPSPDLWDEITSRPLDATTEGRGLRHRIAAGLVAAIVSIAAFAFLVTVFRPEPDRDAVGTAASPLTIRVWTTKDPFDVHFSATFEGEEIDLVAIETPGPDLEYPDNASMMDLPVGTPIVIEPSEATSVSVFELDPAKGEFVVENGSCVIPGSLQALPGPDETAFFIYADVGGGSAGQAFRAETVGESLDHDSVLDPNSTVDASELGLATCDADPSLLVSSSGPSGGQAVAGGTLTSRNGCLTVSGYDSPLYVVWPNGYSLAEEGDDVWLVDESGDRIARIGDYVLMDGESRDLARAESEVVGGIPSSCEVVDGPDAYWFAGTPELVESSATGAAPTSAEYLPLVFPVFGNGWNVRNFDSVEEGTATKAWAATVAIDARDLGPRKPAIPVHTIESLPPGEAVIVALATPWSHDPDEGPYPPGRLDPLRLSDATIRGPVAEEPEGDYTIYDIQNRGHTTARVFFRGTPTGAELEGAQAQLATLEVPPTCPVGYETTASPVDAAPGETVTLTGPMPFQRQDGSFDVEGRTIAIAWWNADQRDWGYLSSFSTDSPSPVASGPIVRLGEGGVGQCSFSITFTVPDVPPGDYPIVIIHEGPLPSPNGSALLASLSVRVR